MEEQQTEKIGEKKKSMWWIWLIVGLVVIAVGIGIYFWLSGDSSLIVNGGNSIPQPPALPS